MKPNVYTQLYIHLVFSVKHREYLLNDKAQKSEIYRYISGIINKQNHKSIIINGMPDHVHLLIGLNPKDSISGLVKELKRCSSKFINDKKWFKGHFAWQEGYGAFSYSRSQLEIIYQYIENQEFHHLNKSFREEYLSFLKKFDIEFKSEYLFEFFD